MVGQKNFIFDSKVRILAKHLQEKQNPNDQEQKLIKNAISQQDKAAQYEWVANILNLVVNYLQLSTNGNFILKYSMRKEDAEPLETVVMIEERIQKLEAEIERNKEIAAKQAIKKAFLDHGRAFEKGGTNPLFNFSSEQEIKYSQLVMDMRLENRNGAEKLLKNVLKDIKPEIINLYKDFIKKIVFLTNEAAKEVEDVAKVEKEEMEDERREALLTEKSDEEAIIKLSGETEYFDHENE